MDQSEILSTLGEESISKHIEAICEIHSYTKKYLLLAEELSEEGYTFLQPLKEHRDAYEHLMRVFSLPARYSEPIKINHNTYIKENIKKALGHEYRAFFDTMDWLTYICRKYIRQTLSLRWAKRAYIKKYSQADYYCIKERVNKVPFEIARLRDEKDIGKDLNILKEVDEYRQIVDNLILIYNKVQTL